VYNSIVQSIVVVQVLRTDERSHRSYELTTIYVLLDLNNVFINRFCAFDILGVAPIRLSSRSSTSGRVTRSPGLPSSLFVFSFLLKWSCGLQGWNSFLEGYVVLSSTSTF